MSRCLIILTLIKLVLSNESTMFDFASITPSRLTPFDIEAYTKAAVIRQNQENAFIAHMSTLAAARRASIARDPVKNGTKPGTNYPKEDVHGIPELLQRFLIQREKDHLAQIQSIMFQGQSRGILGEDERFRGNDRSNQMIERFLNQNNRRNNIYQKNELNSGAFNSFPVFNREFSRERSPITVTSAIIDSPNKEETHLKRLSMPKKINEDSMNETMPLTSFDQIPMEMKEDKIEQSSQISN
uniref:Corticotropin-releasing factor domain-containing protein n=1 Tax=Strongyloides stercoralis TaxID=6248 RepID=A0A0K0DUY2_STRER